MNLPFAAGRVSDHTVTAPLSTVSQLLTACSYGRPFILVDELFGPQTGTMAIAAEFTDANCVNDFTRDARGLVCLSLCENIVDRLGLTLMTQHNRVRPGVAFTVSIEARQGISTGISTHDRAATIAAAISDDATEDDMASPGHIFPIRVSRYELMIRHSASAAAVELCRQAGCKPAAMVCGIMNDQGDMADMAQLVSLAERLGMPLGHSRDVAAVLCH